MPLFLQVALPLKNVRSALTITPAIADTSERGGAEVVGKIRNKKEKRPETKKNEKNRNKNKQKPEKNNNKKTTARTKKTIAGGLQVKLDEPEMNRHKCLFLFFISSTVMIDRDDTHATRLRCLVPFYAAIRFEICLPFPFWFWTLLFFLLLPQVCDVTQLRVTAHMRVNMIHLGPAPRRLDLSRAACSRRFKIQD